MNSLQKIFNAAWEHFIINKSPTAVDLCIGDNGGTVLTCCYLTRDGHKCAIGLSIPDDHPARFETCGFRQLVARHPDLFPDLLYSNIDFATFQYNLHDEYVDFGTHGWKVDLDARREIYRKTAIMYNLKVPE